MGNPYNGPVNSAREANNYVVNASFYEAVGTLPENSSPTPGFLPPTPNSRTAQHLENPTMAANVNNFLYLNSSHNIPSPDHGMYRRINPNTPVTLRNLPLYSQHQSVSADFGGGVLKTSAEGFYYPTHRGDTQKKDVDYIYFKLTDPVLNSHYIACLQNQYFSFKQLFMKVLPSTFPNADNIAINEYVANQTTDRGVFTTRKYIKDGVLIDRSGAIPYINLVNFIGNAYVCRHNSLFICVLLLLGQKYNTLPLGNIYFCERDLYDFSYDPALNFEQNVNTDLNKATSTTAHAITLYAPANEPGKLYYFDGRNDDRHYDLCDEYPEIIDKWSRKKEGTNEEVIEGRQTGIDYVFGILSFVQKPIDLTQFLIYLKSRGFSGSAVFKCIETFLLPPYQLSGNKLEDRFEWFVRSLEKTPFAKLDAEPEFLGSLRDFISNNCIYSVYSRELNLISDREQQYKATQDAARPVDAVYYVQYRCCNGIAINAVPVMVVVNNFQAPGSPQSSESPKSASRISSPISPISPIGSSPNSSHLSSFASSPSGSPGGTKTYYWSPPPSPISPPAGWQRAPAPCYTKKK